MRQRIQHDRSHPCELFDDIWLTCLNLDEHEFELMDATTFMPHDWILGARLSDHTDDAMSSVVFDADSEFVMLIRMR